MFIVKFSMRPNYSTHELSHKVHEKGFETVSIAGVANLRLASHRQLFEGLFVALDKCPRVPFSFLCYHISKNHYRSVCISFVYLHESFYSTLKFVKSKHRSVLANQHLKELLRSAVTNYLPNFKELSREVK